MEKITFTKAEKRLINQLGPVACILAFEMHDNGGEGAFTVGERFLKDFKEPRQYQRSGDVLINAGRKLANKIK